MLSAHGRSILTRLTRARRIVAEAADEAGNSQSAAKPCANARTRHETIANAIGAAFELGRKDWRMTNRFHLMSNVRHRQNSTGPKYFAP